MIQRKQHSDSAYDLEKTKLSDSQAEAEEIDQSRHSNSIALIDSDF